MTTDASTKRALVIDDDEHIRELLQAILGTAGFEVDTLSDGIDAVELKKDYHVILLDMRMPIFDGARLTDYWRLTDPAILDRVILLTGYSRLTKPDFGAFASLAKPFDYRELLTLVDVCSLQRDP
jgi:two-component system OmpR family response regulator